MKKNKYIDTRFSVPSFRLIDAGREREPLSVTSVGEEKRFASMTQTERRII